MIEKMARLNKSISRFFICGAAIFSASIFLGCDRRPKEVLSEKEMVSLMADMQLAEACLNSSAVSVHSGDGRLELGRSVLAAHGVTQEQLDTTLAWYGRNIDNYSELFEKVDKEIVARRKKLMKGAETDFDETEAGNLWRYGSHSYLAALGNSDAWILSVDEPEMSSGDMLEWSLHLLNPIQLSGVLGVEYDDGSSEATTNMFIGRPKIEMRLQTDTGKNVKRIYGVLRAKESSDLPVHADSIRLRKLPFDSLEYRKIRGQKRYGLPSRISKKNVEKDSLSLAGVDSSEAKINGSATEVSSGERGNKVKTPSKSGTPIKFDLNKSISHRENKTQR